MGTFRLQDVALTLGVIAFGLLSIAFDLGPSASTPSTAAYLVVFVGGAALLARRVHPAVVLLLIAGARLVVTWHAGNSAALIPAIWMALYTMTRSGERRRALVLATLVATVTMIGVAALEADPFLPELLGECALLVLPIAVGDAARTRSDRVRDLIDTEANIRVQAERARIARDLHDVVAHGLSTIAVQSGIAAHLLDQDPTQAKDALEIINTTGKSSLEELRAMVGVLRSTDEAPLRPIPTDPNNLSAVIEGATNAGITVTTNVSGSFPTNASDSCVVALHRIIQEALTNVARHAVGAQAHVEVQHRPDDVVLTISNDAGQPATIAAESTGAGLIGMVERAEAVGGTLTANPTVNGGFEVAATLPHTIRKQ